MIGLEINISVDTDNAIKKFVRFKQKFSAPVLLKLIGIKHLSWINANFRAGGLESKWKPLSPNTIASRRQGGSAGGAQPLRDTGRLTQSFTYKVFGEESVAVGTGIQYASYHHFGTGPYTIRPKNKKFLMFQTVGGTVFARAVHHPGLPPRRLLPSEALAREMAVGELKAYIKTSID